jgi:hypothetical protein
MPLLDEPFKRVAVDIVGLIHSITDKGNRYIDIENGEDDTSQRK